MGMEEKVLVVPNAHLDGLLQTSFTAERAEKVKTIANQHRQFMARSQAEHDESFKQIIPYVAICHGNMHLLLRRTAKQTEARLHDKLSLGIGGHINEIELTNAGVDLVRAGMLRELDEEVELKGDYEVRPVGVIYDGSNPVGRVHLGLAFRVECKGSDFTLKEPDLMTGEWVPRAQLKEFFPAMESWSQHLVTGLFS